MQLVRRDDPTIKPGVGDIDGETERRRESVSCKPRRVAWTSRGRAIGRQVVRNNLRRAFIEYLRRSPRLDVDYALEGRQVGDSAGVNPDSQIGEVEHAVSVNQHP